MLCEAFQDLVGTLGRSVPQHHPFVFIEPVKLDLGLEVTEVPEIRFCHPLACKVMLFNIAGMGRFDLEWIK